MLTTSEIINVIVSTMTNLTLVNEQQRATWLILIKRDEIPLFSLREPSKRKEGQKLEVLATVNLVSFLPLVSTHLIIDFAKRIIISVNASLLANLMLPIH